MAFAHALQFVGPYGGSSVAFLFFQYIFALVMLMLKLMLSVWLFCANELGSFPANRTTSAQPRS